jgi:hypothetical protein
MNRPRKSLCEILRKGTASSAEEMNLEFSLSFNAFLISRRRA